MDCHRFERTLARYVTELKSEAGEALERTALQAASASSRYPAPAASPALLGDLCASRAYSLAKQWWASPAGIAARTEDTTAARASAKRTAAQPSISAPPGYFGGEGVEGGDGGAGALPDKDVLLRLPLNQIRFGHALIGARFEDPSLSILQAALEWAIGFRKCEGSADPAFTGSPLVVSQDKVGHWICIKGNRQLAAMRLVAMCRPATWHLKVPAWSTGSLDMHSHPGSDWVYVEPCFKTVPGWQMIGRTKEPGTYGLDLLAYVWPDNDTGRGAPSIAAATAPSAPACLPASSHTTSPPQRPRRRRKPTSRMQARSPRRPVRSPTRPSIIRNIAHHRPLAVRRRRSGSGSRRRSGSSSSSESKRGSRAEGLTEALVLELYDWYRVFGNCGGPVRAKPGCQHDSSEKREDAEELTRRVIDRLGKPASVQAKSKARNRALPPLSSADNVSATQRRSAREAAERAVDRVAARAREFACGHQEIRQQRRSRTPRTRHEGRASSGSAGRR